MKAWDNKTNLSSFLTSALNVAEWLTSHSGHFTPEGTPIPNEYEVMCAPEPVGTFRGKKKPLTPTEIQTPDNPARSLVTMPTTLTAFCVNYVFMVWMEDLPKQWCYL